MVTYECDDKFKKELKKLDNSRKPAAKKLIKKVIDRPTVGKPMRNFRKGTRELYLSPFRLSYHYDEENDFVLFLHIYHKKKQ